MISWRLSLKLLLIALGVSAVLLALGCTPSHPQSTFDPAGPIAEKQRDLFLIIFWAAVVVFVVVVGALLYTVIRYRRRRGQTEIPAQTHGNTKLEVSWTIAPAVVLAVIAIPTVIYTFDISADAGPDALQIDVTGHQWWWEFEYPEYDLVTANEMHIPVDRQVQLTLRSDDVIHSFWIPKLAGKLDVVPSNVNKMRFTASETGEFLGQCAEFCGVAHALMKFRVFADTQEDFDAWVAEYHSPSTPPSKLGQTGATLFASRGCLLCHTVDGPSTAASRQSLKDAFERGELRFPAPNLTTLGTRTTIAGGLLEMTRRNLERWLRDPDEVKEGNRMAQLANVYVDPQSKLAEEEISALAAYLLSLTGPPPTTTTADELPACDDPGDLVECGRQVFVSQASGQPLWCSQCHTIEGVSIGLIGPDLTHMATDAATRIPGTSAEDYIRQSITAPESFVAEGVDRATTGLMTTDITSGLDKDQVDALVAFLLAQK